MKCHTISHQDASGNSVFKEKQKFDTLDEAISVAKSMNLKEDRLFKVVAYKCNYCHQYHVGKNGNIVREKDRDRIKARVKYVY